ncbi:MAG TPA: hypothetical protein VG895_04735 [Patescibacteria group bacterium]|nr:hypothetical protein [Patescibacteria group bacterium]
MQTEYKTKDLAEAAALIVEGQSLLFLKREGRTCWFVFSNFSSSKQISDKFFFGDLLVNARKYKEAIDLLKSRIFARE